MKAGAKIDVSGCPDLMPVLAATAASSPGLKEITGGKRLREKESDRISSVTEGLLAVGIHCEEKDDGLVISGGEIAGGTVRSHNDHRIAMAFSSLCVVSKGDIVIKGAECVNKSYPLFFEDLKKIGGAVE
jgi:3-phosphoshikimate 1-carboxyvinyltransferase